MGSGYYFPFMDAGSLENSYISNILDPASPD
jgi:hypothetical protein